MVTAVAVTAALGTALPLLADDKVELTFAAVTDTTSTQVLQDGDNGAKSTLATCPAVCEGNPKGWRDAVLSFDVTGLPAGATGVTATMRLFSWERFATATTVHAGGPGTGVVASRPAVGGALSSTAEVSKGYNTWDVSSVVRADGTYTFTVRQAGLASRVYWASRENKNSSIRPQLVLSYRSAADAKPSTSATSARPAPSSAAPVVPPTSRPAPSSASAPAPATPTRTVTASPTVTQPKPEGWQLAWSDEFDGSQLDKAKWQAKDNTMVDYDLACITADGDNVFVKGGLVTLRVQKEKETCGKETRDYSTSYLTTQGRASFTYGRFEVRAKTPTGRDNSTGLWPAFWLRPDDGGVGEIDVMELPGGAKYYRAATQAIFLDYTPVKQDHRYEFPSGYPADGFHTYTTEWEPGVLRWYIDGKLVWQRDRSTTPWFDKAFSRPFHLRLNFQVGGWLGDPDAATRFPADFQVDHVRVWKRN
jgi:beta-glucanase (GH16 family)